jgi:Amt family ammonium transporter
VVYGLTAGIGCNYATQLKFLFGVDDALDIFAVHCVGGIIGNLLTGFMAADYIAHLDGFSVIQGGWVNRHWVQLAIQLADSVAGMAYSFVMTTTILLIMAFVGTKVPAMRLRVSEEEEERGIDDVGKSCSSDSSGILPFD